MALRTYHVRFCVLTLLLAGWGISFGARPGWGENCKDVTPDLEQSITNYLQEWYDIPKDNALRITDINPVGNSCYRGLAQTRDVASLRSRRDFSQRGRNTCDPGGELTNAA